MKTTLGSVIRDCLRDNSAGLTIAGIIEDVGFQISDLCPDDKALRASERLANGGSRVPESKKGKLELGRRRLVQEAAQHLVHRRVVRSTGTGDNRIFIYCGEDVTVAKEIKDVLIDLIRLDGTQQRAEIRSDIIEEYAEHIDDLPPAIVFHDGTHYYLADGFHRLNAHVSMGKSTMPCEVRLGSHRDAVLFSVGSNAQHGLRRSPADLKRSIETLMADPEWCKSSVEWLAKTARCSWSVADRVRKEWLQQHNAPDGPRTGADGRSYTSMPKSTATGSKKEDATTSRAGSEESPKPSLFDGGNGHTRKAVIKTQDKAGRLVPECLHEVFADTRPQALAKQLGDLADAFDVAATSGMTSPMAHIGMKGLQSIQKQLSKLHFDFLSSMPHAVCDQCGGEGKTCTQCDGKGFLTAEGFRQAEAKGRRRKAGDTGGDF